MSTTTKEKAPLATLPASLPASETLLDTPETEFPPSAELGEQLSGMEEAQVEIDRKKAEELARLRELQDRD